MDETMIEAGEDEKKPSASQSGRLPGSVALALAAILVGVIGAVVYAGWFMIHHNEYTRGHAGELVELIQAAARKHYDAAQAGSDAGVLPNYRFPASTDWTPAGSDCTDPTIDSDGDGLCDGNTTDWKHPSWQKLNFSIDGPQEAQYRFLSEGAGESAKFTVQARFWEYDSDRLVEASVTCKASQNACVYGRRTVRTR